MTTMKNESGSRAEKIKAVLLLSGGLDSTTLCALASSQGREIHALSFDYHQRHRCELDAARRAAARWKAAEHIVLSLDLSLFGGSSLTDASIPVDHETPLERIGEKIPTSYVPARNTVFLSLALAYAETRGASELWIGVNQVDYSGYPDCRAEFIETFEKLANLATRAGVEDAKSGRRAFRVVAPLSKMSKAEIVALGTRLGVDYAETVTCYSPDGDGRACGECEACRLRRAGFEEAGLPDPTRYVGKIS
ncbi:MAG: 7-cyano-7-deazaguanine synthase QueC [Thermoguttaceae bacterium]|nr:7-cyano-7-deazaguanine synthase QueC [Thermoguttaceae bacterium]